MFKTGLAWGRCSSNVHRKEGETDSGASVKEASCFREMTLGRPRSGSAGRRGEVQWEMMRDGAGESGRNQVKQDHGTQGEKWEPLKYFNQEGDLWMI